MQTNAKKHNLMQIKCISKKFFIKKLEKIQLVLFKVKFIAINYIYLINSL